MKIKFQISYSVLPKWYQFESEKHFGREIEIELKNFKSIQVFQKTELPYIKTFLKMNEKNISAFFDELTNQILLKNENVSALSFGGSLRIYNQDFSKEINRWQSLFKIPSSDQNLKTHKEKKYRKYFRAEELFTTTNNKVEPLNSEYIGFTGRTTEELAKGKELLCYVHLSGTVEPVKEFVFLPMLTKVLRRGKDRTSEYYIATKDTVNSICHFLYILAEKHPGYESIIVGSKFFEENLLDLDKVTDDSFLFDSKINHYLKFELVDNKFQIRQNKKAIFECSDIKSYYIYDAAREEQMDRIMLGSHRSRPYLDHQDDLPF